MSWSIVFASSCYPFQLYCDWEINREKSYAKTLLISCLVSLESLLSAEAISSFALTDRSCIFMMRFEDCLIDFRVLFFIVLPFKYIVIGKLIGGLCVCSCSGIYELNWSSAFATSIMIEMFCFSMYMEFFSALACGLITTR